MNEYLNECQLYASLWLGAHIYPFISTHSNLVTGWLPHSASPHPKAVPDRSTLQETEEGTSPGSWTQDIGVTYVEARKAEWKEASITTVQL